VCCYAKDSTSSPYLTIHVYSSSKSPAVALKVLQLDFTSLIRSYISDSQTSTSRLSPIRDLQLPSYLDAPRVFYTRCKPIKQTTSPLAENSHSLDDGCLQANIPFPLSALTKTPTWTLLLFRTRA